MRVDANEQQQTAGHKNSHRSFQTTSDYRGKRHFEFPLQFLSESDGVSDSQTYRAIFQYSTPSGEDGFTL